MPGNRQLHAARQAQRDEFYTQMADITNELSHYMPHFKGKTVFCNCDDPYESNFSKYFVLMFNDLGLKRLICTCYDGSPVTGTQLELFENSRTSDGRSKVAYKIEITSVPTEVNIDNYKEFIKEHCIEVLKENGDFRSDECVELLKQADIVVTNPPFSLFREFVAQLFEYDKKFLIIGNQNAITYKDIFSHIKDNKLWLGYKFGDMSFQVPPYYEERETRFWVDETGQKWRSLGTICWFTNLDHDKRHYPLDLYKRYSPEEFPMFDNYDAIEVGKVADIPMDYDGVMGVPITYLDKYCPEQFEILGITDRQNTSGLRTKKYTIEDDKRFNDLNARGVLKTKTGYKSIYARILIRKKQ